MTVDDMINLNPNPSHFVSLILSKEHERCFKQLRYYHPIVANDLTNAPDQKAAALIWQAFLVKQSISGASRITVVRPSEERRTA